MITNVLSWINKFSLRSLYISLLAIAILLIPFLQACSCDASEQSSSATVSSDAREKLYSNYADALDPGVWLISGNEILKKLGDDVMQSFVNPLKILENQIKEKLLGSYGSAISFIEDAVGIVALFTYYDHANVLRGIYITMDEQWSASDDYYPSQELRSISGLLKSQEISDALPRMERLQAWLASASQSSPGASGLATTNEQQATEWAHKTLASASSFLKSEIEYFRTDKSNPAPTSSNLPINTVAETLNNPLYKLLADFPPYGIEPIQYQFWNFGIEEVNAGMRQDIGNSNEWDAHLLEVIISSSDKTNWLAFVGHCVSTGFMSDRLFEAITGEFSDLEPIRASLKLDNFSSSSQSGKNSDYFEIWDSVKLQTTVALSQGTIIMGNTTFVNQCLDAANKQIPSVLDNKDFKDILDRIPLTDTARAIIICNAGKMEDTMKKCVSFGFYTDLEGLDSEQQTEIYKFSDANSAKEAIELFGTDTSYVKQEGQFVEVNNKTKQSEENTAYVTNSIKNFRVVSTSNNEIIFNVDYIYCGDHGNEVFLDALALQGEKKTFDISGPFTSVSKGTGTATITLQLGFVSGLVTTDRIEVRFVVIKGQIESEFYTKTFNYTKTWSN